jgi:hypothetical protein
MGDPTTNAAKTFAYESAAALKIGGGGSHRRTCLRSIFPVSRENTGKFWRVSPVMAKPPRIANEFSAFPLNSLTIRAGNFAG